MVHKKIPTLEVVLKIAERCNINCSYCYMFNRGNEDYLTHPVYISEKTIEQVANWIERAVLDYSIPLVTIILHGGEPLMLKRDRFDRMCQLFQDKIGKIAHFRFTIQTNATLVDEKWIAIFAKYRINVGVSLDGPAAINDVNRVDHKGRGTYAATIKGLEILQRACAHDLVAPVGAICVIDPTQDGKAIYRHLIDDLKFNTVSFVLPMDSYDQVKPGMPERVAAYLADVFSEWTSDDNPYITVRIFSQFLRFLGTGAQERAMTVVNDYDAVIVAVASNGDISVNDDLKVINLGQAIGNVANTSLRQFLATPMLAYLADVWKTVPAECNECPWVGYCRGGAQQQVVSNRYSKQNGFNNKSVFCDALKATYSQLAGWLVKTGLPQEHLLERLYLARSDIVAGTLPPPPAKVTIPIRVAP